MMQTKTTNTALAVVAAVFSGSHSHHSSLKWRNTTTWRRVTGNSIDNLRGNA
ncbi:MAG: hypothetical protein FWH37_08185 [Candidatus Bathyarchaeota archaeon]|nr:hypothetical protein [Candidatus Termiticorpusculum sp.]